MRIAIAIIAFIVAGLAAPDVQAQNLIVFVADGLRAAAVTPETAPTMSRIRLQGVDFRNSHSLFPTITTANASVIATGHFQGDTGDFGNTLYLGFPAANANGLLTPFVQDNGVLGELNQHTGGNFINERSLMAAARERGYLTAALGKVGPVAIQDVTQLDGATTVFFDDQTGHRHGITVRADIAEKLKAAGLGVETPRRGGTPGTSNNATQQAYYRDIVTKVLLPAFKAAGKPFMLVYWSPDPDATQHAQLDSPNELTPGINGPTSMSAIKLADDDLAAILEAVKELGLETSTNIFVTADHGFSTVSKQSTTSPSAKFIYQDVPAGQLPPGFLAIDLAEALGLALHEPTEKGPAVDYKGGKYPRRASAVLGPDPAKPDIVIAANGGNDLIHLPQANAKELAVKIVKVLLAQDYTSGVFVDDALGPIPGTLPLSAIGLKGGALTPTPSIVVNFRSYTTGCDRPLWCAVLVSDVPFKQGQGMHGSFSRADTANFMAAIGPAFKSGFANPAPVSNADIAPTLAHIIGVELPPKGTLKGRVLTEILKDGAPVEFEQRDLVSPPNDAGLRTIVNLQYVGNTPYFDAAGFAGRTVGLRVPAGAQ